MTAAIQKNSNHSTIKNWLSLLCSFIIIVTMLFVNGYTGEEWLEPSIGALFFPFLFSGLMLALIAVSSGTFATQNQSFNAMVTVLNRWGHK